MAAQFIREINYSTWLSNVIIVKKQNKKLRMCTNYIDLNRACPKNAYPLSNMNHLVDGANRHKMLSFLDAYSSNNKIKMDLGDEEKKIFITEFANFCYKVMPFGLKNAGVTYQRLMDKVFKSHLGQNLEVYVDDMVVKYDNLATPITDLKEVFGQLRRYNMRLNTKKFVFEVKGGKFLGFMLTHRGIHVNLNKFQAIIEMRIPQNVKEAQRIADRIASLLRFLPRIIKRAKSIMNLFKKTNKFV